MTTLISTGIFDQTTILEKVPFGLLVMDSRGQMQPVNKVIEKTFGVTGPESLGTCMGEALGCMNSERSEESCGRSRCCKECALHKTAAEALALNQTCKAQGMFHLTINGTVYEKRLLFQAMPFEHEGKCFALLSVNDVTKLALLQPSRPKEFSCRTIGRHPCVVELLALLEEAACTSLPVLLQGESGTGKELAARDIHDWSDRKDKPFIVVNCGALPPGLFESELFGHVKGAFTDAVRDKKGRFELADGGTIFLDEIGELAPAQQVKLLRVMQEGCVEPVGGITSKQVNVRLISATNKNLQEEMNAGRFRLDLFYRLCVVPITLPPLRERAGDIPVLGDHFLARSDRNSGVIKKSLSPRTIEILQKYSWPGNIRELQNVIQFAMMKCSGATINQEHLPAYLTHEKPGDVESIHVHKKSRLTKGEVMTALTKNRGNKVKTARELGVARATFYRFIKDGMNGTGAMTSISHF